jgi:hypothetical protein
VPPAWLVQSTEAWKDHRMQIAVNGTRLWFDVDGPGLEAREAGMGERLRGGGGTAGGRRGLTSIHNRPRLEDLEGV